MDRERSIIHFNVADFAVAVERACDSSLRGRPLIIAPPRSARAVVYDMSEEAFSCGVRKRMPLVQAVRRCREAAVLPPRIELYGKAMQDCLKRVRRFSPLVEHGAADGHLFVDMTGTHRLFGPAPDVGWRVRKEVASDLGVSPIWTVSPNKLVAKVASRVVKPVGEYIVGAGEEEEFLAPLPVSLLPGLHWRERRRLQELNIATIGQLARLSAEELMVPFGSRSGFLHDAGRGIDREQVVDGTRQTAGLTYERCFADDTNDEKEVRTALLDMAARAGGELRRTDRAARRVAVRLSYSDGAVISRQSSRRVGTCSDMVIREMALGALQRAWKRRVRLRGCRLVCDKLHRRSPQLSLFEALPGGECREERVNDAMDAVSRRFGRNLIGRGGHHGSGTVAMVSP